jgi:rubrerythrin
MRGIITASMAEKEDFKNVARLSRAIAYAKQVHIPSHYEALMEYKEDVKVGFHGNATKKMPCLWCI